MWDVSVDCEDAAAAAGAAIHGWLLGGVVESGNMRKAEKGEREMEGRKEGGG